MMRNQHILNSNLIPRSVDSSFVVGKRLALLTALSIFHSSTLERTAPSDFETLLPDLFRVDLWDEGDKLDRLHSPLEAR
jgi:hypothetical protein